MNYFVWYAFFVSLHSTCNILSSNTSITNGPILSISFLIPAWCTANYFSSTTAPNTLRFSTARMRNLTRPALPLKV